MSKDFSFIIETGQLATGLRPNKRTPRESTFLTESKGAFGSDGVLSSVDELSRIDTSDITDSFPFPQIFVFTNMIIVCGRDKIYELVNNSLALKLTVTGKSTWAAVDFYNYVYLSNGLVAVIRDPDTGVYSITTDLPSASDICNFNGQVIISSPGATVPGADLLLADGSSTITLTGQGDFS
jgi:hypothetical protein